MLPLLGAAIQDTTICGGIGLVSLVYQIQSFCGGKGFELGLIGKTMFSILPQ